MECQKTGELRSNGWSNSYRYVHGISSGIRNILQLYYIYTDDVIHIRVLYFTEEIQMWQL